MVEPIRSKNCNVLDEPIGSDPFQNLAETLGQGALIRTMGLPMA